MSLSDTLLNFFFQYGWDKTYWIAYSGGLDSHVLLSLCHALRNSFPLRCRVVHLNHKLSPHADKWAAHCASVCAEYEIPYHEAAIHLDWQPGQSLEETARNKRYAVFAEYLAQDDILLTAHHQNDQAETVLLQLLRGAGPKGLAAMPAVKAFGRGLHARPLLAVPRSLLQDYAEKHALTWIEDESNANTQFTRNFIRHELMPMLKTRWPAAAETLSRSAAFCAETQSLLEELAFDLMLACKGTQPETLSVSQLLKRSTAEQKLILRLWIQQKGCPLPSVKKMTAILNDMLNAAWDRMPCVNWGDVQIRRYRDDLYFMPAQPQHDWRQLFTWHLKQALVLPQVGTLSASLTEGQGLKAEIEQVSIGFQAGNQSLHLPYRGACTLKNLYQEWGIPPWERKRLPLIFCEDKLIGMAGLLIDQRYAAVQGETGWDIQFLKNVF